MRGDDRCLLCGRLAQSFGPYTIDDCLCRRCAGVRAPRTWWWTTLALVVLVTSAVVAVWLYA